MRYFIRFSLEIEFLSMDMVYYEQRETVHSLEGFMHGVIGHRLNLGILHLELLVTIFMGRVCT